MVLPIRQLQGLSVGQQGCCLLLVYGQGVGFVCPAFSLVFWLVCAGVG